MTYLVWEAEEGEGVGGVWRHLGSVDSLEGLVQVQHCPPTPPHYPHHHSHGSTEASALGYVE